MTSFRILNLFSLTALATLLALAPSPTAAVSGPASGLSLGRQRIHARLAGKKQLTRRASQKCRARSSTSAAPSSTQHVTPKPTSTHAASQPTQTHSSGSSGSSDSGLAFFSQGSKLGLAWADGGASYISNVAGPKMIYTWGATCPSEASKLGMTCLPQLWGWKNVDDFQSVSQTANPPLFLTFNEPNELGQSNMDVTSGISLWKQAVKPLTDKGHKVCSPATSSNPDGLTWVQNFQKQCPECVWDVTCVHWYDTTFEKFQAYVNLWHTTFGKPVLITEFGVQNFNGPDQPTSSEVFSFMDQAIPWMNSQNFIYGYFPFGFMAPPTGINPNMNLLNGDGSVTSLGWVVLDQSGAK